MKKLLAYSTLAASLIVSGHAFAHGAQAKHGGIVQSANDLSFEMVNQDDAIVVYVEDHGKEFSTAGATGKLTLLNGKAKSELPLQPAETNRMAAKGDGKLAKGTKAIASITFANKETVHVRFAVK